MKRTILLTALFPLVLAGTACKKQVATQSMAAAEHVPVKTAAAPVQDAIGQMRQNFQRVHFDTDSATLTGDSKNALKANATIMSQHASIEVEVQGHCDERGTTDYNLALGQRRAQAVADYLAAQGIAKSRVQIVSYGEEKPVARGAGETAWSQNRRAEFVIHNGEAVAMGTVQ
ncbi:MAG: peptidoglycan-associated lipoprotein Pal [Alphaproteobacteria bacterium]|nr:peptidoglycan-associated lipoprotein Pal [Alphaproteobacteria bacterium]